LEEGFRKGWSVELLLNKDYSSEENCLIKVIREEGKKDIDKILLEL
jgi:hypothetical protein